MKLRYFSGFSGIGGFDQGITQVFPDAECIGFSEVDKYAIKIYEKHFPDRTNYGDIRRIDAGTLPDVDMFCGGFPCQDLSIAGKRAGLCGTRSGLFYEIIRIIREKQPRIVFLENVKGLFSSNGGWDFARILLELDESGYDVEWQCLNSKNFGVPQNRERVFIIGHLRGKPWKPVFPLEKTNGLYFETTANCLDSNYHKGWLDHGQRTMIQIAGTNQATRTYSPEGLSKCISNGGGQGAKTGLYQIQSHHPRCGDPTKGGTGNLISSDYSYSLDSIPHKVILPEISNCVDVDGYLRTGARPRDENGKPQLLPIGYRRIRRLTPTECERLQGYPDGWTEQGQEYKYDVHLLGNIWQEINVQLMDVKEKSLIENPDYALCITRDGKNGAIHQSVIQKNERIEVNAQLKAVMEIVTAENCVCDITNHGSDMMMLSSQSETSKIDEIIKQNHILERMEKNATNPLLKICLEENLSKEKLSIILIWIKEIISTQTFICVRTEQPIMNAIILWNKSLPNLSKKDSLFLRTANITAISDTQRYKCLGNAVTVNVIDAIVRRMHETEYRPK